MSSRRGTGPALPTSVILRWRAEREAAAGARRGRARSLVGGVRLADLQEARAAFEEISGRRTTEDLLAHIFRSSVSGSEPQPRRRNTKIPNHHVLSNP
jgi:hypothetical protein